ncbi:RcnB family protein [Pseudomonas graminis]|uniref:RcnB family protein n=1 Tax=Pseudomonas graminis TaxID=158627 RepID=UPI0023499B49|nr:RcnB family protein [Pseudomonas graminis]MDC6383127.1 RcnB family protein [Pseudomonas graminis]
MNSKSLIAGLAILGCISAASFTVQAADATEPTIQPSRDNMRELEVGSRSPQEFQRPAAAIKDWKTKGLEEPAKMSQWVRINDKYVEVQTTNGQITKIVPVEK